MKSRLLITAVTASLLMFSGWGRGAEKEEPKAESKAQARADLQVLVGKVQNKISEGKKTEQDLADELKEFDTLLARHKDEKTDDVAQILLMKAMLYIQIFENPEKGMALITQLKKDFPETSPASKADDMLASLKQQEAAAKQQEAAKKIQRGMTAGAKFPDFQEQDLDGKPLSVANYKGKVVLVDFWATWCGPCVAELPNVLQTYEKYHPKGFEIVGISLDSDKARLTSFLAQRKMTWRQYFDGKG